MSPNEKCGRRRKETHSLQAMRQDSGRFEPRDLGSYGRILTRSKKIFVSSLLLLACRCCFAQTDTNLIAAGDWSALVRADESEPFLRGRLLVYDAIQGKSVADHTRIYLELQDVSTNGWYGPIEIYCFGTNLDFELQDGRGKSIPGQGMSTFGFSLAPCWVTLPCDATVRFRADDCCGGLDPKPNGLEIITANKCWVIPPNATNDFYLTCSFTPSADHPSPLHYIVWHGTLNLPPVKIPAKSLSGK